MSMMGQINDFLRLQIKQLSKGIFIIQTKYAKELVRKFRLENAKSILTPMSLTLKLDKDPIGASVDIKKY